MEKRKAEEDALWYYKSDLRLKGRQSNNVPSNCALLLLDDDLGWTKYDETEMALIERAFQVFPSLFGSHILNVHSAR